VLQDLKQESPGDGVKCFEDIQLEKYLQLFLGVQKLSCLLNHNEIILNELPFNESTLVLGNQLIHVKGQLVRKDLSDKLGKTMNKVDGPIVSNCCASTFLGNNVMKVELSCLKFLKYLLQTTEMAAMISPFIICQDAL
jgi:hypothetical protein